MENKWVLIALVLGASLTSCVSTQSSLLGNWVLKKTVHEDIPDLQIFNNGLVKFRQRTFKSPCIYDIRGNLQKDTIIRKSVLFCENIDTQKMEFRSVSMDTFKVTRPSKNSILLINIQSNESFEYRRSQVKGDGEIRIISG